MATDNYNTTTTTYPATESSTLVPYWVDSMCSNISLDANLSICNDTNSTGNGTSVEVPYVLPHPLWLTILLGTAACIVIIVTVLGNVMVLLSFFIERALRQPTNYFIASLAMSDLLIGIFSMPCFTIYILLDYWPLGEIICDIWLSLDWTVCLASQYTVFFITADRFCSVKIPAKYRNWRTEVKVRMMIACSWIIPSLVFFISIIGWQYFVGERTVSPNQCEVQFMSNPLFTFLLTIGYYWTTLTVMIVLYVGIYRVALKLQRKANEKHKKMSHAMELGGNKKAKAKAKAKTNAVTKPKKESKKRMENNNARHLRGPNDHTTLTTSFSKNSDAEYSKPSEEDRSSSPAFASDEDDSDKKESCYVNSAVQTETTLKGMLGTSFNHMSRLAFSISGTSVTTSQASQSSDRDTSDDQHKEVESDKPLIIETKQVQVYKPIKEDTHKLSDIIDSVDRPEEEKHLSFAHMKEVDILDGLKYIDEDSLKSLTSAENVKLLNEIMDKPHHQKTINEAESPVWRRRIPEDDKTLLVPISGDSASSEATSSNMTDYSARPSDKQTNHVPNNRHSKSPHKKRKGDKGSDKHDTIQTANHSESKSKSNKYGSPLQSLVKSLRPHSKDQQKKAKSKSENRARKALRTISIILGAYVLCWTPYHVMILIIGICGDWSCINLRFYYFTYWLCYLNSPINPFCYAFANAQFKRTFIRILKLDFHRT